MDIRGARCLNNAGQSHPTMKFLAVLIAAIFLSGSALAETTSTPISSRFAAAAKAAKVSSKVKNLAPRVCPRAEDDECRAWCCTCGAKCSGTDCIPRPSLQFSVLRLQLAGNLFEVLTEQLDRDQLRGAGVYS